MHIVETKFVKDPLKISFAIYEYGPPTCDRALKLKLVNGGLSLYDGSVMACADNNGILTTNLYGHDVANNGQLGFKSRIPVAIDPNAGGLVPAQTFG